MPCGHSNLSQEAEHSPSSWWLAYAGYLPSASLKSHTLYPISGAPGKLEEIFLMPWQKIEFIGTLLDFLKATAYLPHSRLVIIVRGYKSIVEQPSDSNEIVSDNAGAHGSVHVCHSLCQISSLLFAGLVEDYFHTKNASHRHAIRIPHQYCHL